MGGTQSRRSALYSMLRLAALVAILAAPVLGFAAPAHAEAETVADEFDPLLYSVVVTRTDCTPISVWLDNKSDEPATFALFWMASAPGPGTTPDESADAATEPEELPIPQAFAELEVKPGSIDIEPDDGPEYGLPIQATVNGIPVNVDELTGECTAPPVADLAPDFCAGTVAVLLDATLSKVEARYLLVIWGLDAEGAPIQVWEQDVRVAGGELWTDDVRVEPGQTISVLEAGSLVLVDEIVMQPCPPISNTPIPTAPNPMSPVTPVVLAPIVQGPAVQAPVVTPHEHVAVLGNRFAAEPQVVQPQVVEPVVIEPPPAPDAGDEPSQETAVLGTKFSSTPPPAQTEQPRLGLLAWTTGLLVLLTAAGVVLAGRARRA